MTSFALPIIIQTFQTSLLAVASALLTSPATKQSFSSASHNSGLAAPLHRRRRLCYFLVTLMKKSLKLAQIVALLKTKLNITLKKNESYVKQNR